MGKYKLIDLFAGAGGITTGFHWAGFETVFANEYDAAIAESYRFNYPDTPLMVDDIRNLDFEKIKKDLNLKTGEIDVIAGGPPCQGFSMANRKRIENDKRNLLFLEFVRAVDVFRPKCFLIENVMGMKSESVAIANKNISVDDSIASFFKDLGYQISFKSFKSEEHGVPQIRRRVIIVGTCIPEKQEGLRNGTYGSPQKTHQSKKESLDAPHQTTIFDKAAPEYKAPVTVWEAISDLPVLHAGEGEDTTTYRSKSKNEYQGFLRGGIKKIQNHRSTPHSQEVLERIGYIGQGDNFHQLPERLRTKSVHSGAYGRLVAGGLSPTITTRFDTPSTGRVIHPFQDRTLTVREAARIQSFPDSYIFTGTRTSQGKQVGNAVPPLVAKAIAEMFIKDFLVKDSHASSTEHKPTADSKMLGVCH